MVGPQLPWVWQHKKAPVRVRRRIHGGGCKQAVLIFTVVQRPVIWVLKEHPAGPTGPLLSPFHASEPIRPGHQSSFKGGTKTGNLSYDFSRLL